MNIENNRDKQPLNTTVMFETSSFKFDMPANQQKSIIKVIGVGGGGSNAVNHMYRQGIKGVEFVVCNTDAQALEMSPVPTKVQLGSSLTEGRGAGSIAEVGKNAAIENIEDIRKILLENTRMVFITAGMGGGTVVGPVTGNREGSGTHRKGGSDRDRTYLDIRETEVGGSSSYAQRLGRCAGEYPLCNRTGGRSGS